MLRLEQVNDAHGEVDLLARQRHEARDEENEGCKQQRGDGEEDDFGNGEARGKPSGRLRSSRVEKRESILPSGNPDPW